MRALRMDPATDYTDEERLRQEVLEARRLFARQGWPVIVDEGGILQQLQKRHIILSRFRWRGVSWYGDDRKRRWF